MKEHISIWVLLLIAGQLVAGAPDSLWSRTYGGLDVDTSYSIAATVDGGFVLAGITRSFGSGNGDFWLVKTDNMGNTQWSRTYGGSALERCRSVQQTSDGGYILAGTTRSYGGSPEELCWLLKTNATGDSMWSQTFGDAPYGDECLAVQQTPDGGYILVGQKYYCQYGEHDAWLVKTDALGTAQWSRCLGTGQHDFGMDIEQTTDGGYLVAGIRWNYPGDFFLVKTDNTGNQIWARTIGGPQTDECHAVELALDGSYALAGCTESYGAGGKDFWLVKTDASGIMQWDRTYGGSGDDDAFSLKRTADGGYLLAGYTESIGTGERDMWLVKTDQDGDVEWTRTFGGELLEGAESVIQTADSGYAVAGWTNSFGVGAEDFWLVKTGPEVPVAGYVTLEIPGPPDWDYRLHWVCGSIDRLVFRNLCPGTHGSCCDGASALGWHATDYPDSVVFTSPNPLTSGSLIVFRLYHPYCSDQITWVAGDSSGLIDGPLPVELLSFEAIEGDQQVTLRWATASETDNDYFEVRRAGALVAQVESEGSSTTGHEYTWVDQGLENGVTYVYTLIAVDMNGVQEEIGLLNATPQADTPTVTEYALAQNYPNPFNAVTEIRYAIPEAGHVTLKVYNPAGQVVAELVNQEQSANSYSVHLDAFDLPSGVYFYALSADGFTDARKMVLIK